MNLFGNQTRLSGQNCEANHVEAQLYDVDEENSNIKIGKEPSDVVAQEMLGLIESTCSISDEFRVTQRRECHCLLRRIKLLVPLFEELKDINDPVPDEAVTSLNDLRRSISMAKRLLKTCHDSSKIYLAVDYEAIMEKFNSVNRKISQSLDSLPLEDMGISEETREQVDLMRSQLQRSKRRTDTREMEMVMDMMVVFGKEDCDRNADTVIIKRLAKNMELYTVEQFNAETLAVRKFGKEKSTTNPEMVERMNQFLDKLKQTLGVENDSILNGCDISTIKCQLPPEVQVPSEFLCPISLEIMTDPVILSTGQTYEKESIKTWFDAHNRTCPKTGQVLTNLSMAPNYALKNIITQWCEKNNVQLIKRKPTSTSTSTSDKSEPISPELEQEMMSLVNDLTSTDLDIQRESVHKIRILTKDKPENRILVADCNGIRPLCQLLRYPDSTLQEHAVTCILNLSIDEHYKRPITSEELVIPAIISILKHHANPEARANSAATLFSLSMLDENKVTIGLSGGIPPLVNLLQTGTARGKKDAATALFNLCMNYMNKERAVEAGIVKLLMKLLENKTAGMADEALSITLLLVGHPSGRSEIGQLKFIEMMVGFIRNGTEKNKEGATAILLELGMNGSNPLLAALQYGVYDDLIEITKSGTSRAQRKAHSIIQLMSKYEQLP